MKHSTVVVGAYADAIAAHLARGRLQSAGIDAVLIDEHLVNAQPLFGSAVGGVKVAVASRDATAAQAVLSRPPEPRAPDACPECESTNVTRKDGARRAAFLSILLLGLPFGRSRGTGTCGDCGHVWRA